MNIYDITQEGYRDYSPHPTALKYYKISTYLVLLWTFLPAILLLFFLGKSTLWSVLFGLYMIPFFLCCFSYNKAKYHRKTDAKIDHDYYFEHYRRTNSTYRKMTKLLRMEYGSKLIMMARADILMGNYEFARKAFEQATMVFPDKKLRKLYDNIAGLIKKWDDGDFKYSEDLLYPHKRTLLNILRLGQFVAVFGIVTSLVFLALLFIVLRT